MAIDYTVLKSEVATDPLTLGYAGKDPAQQAVLINAVGSASADINRVSANSEELQYQVVAADYIALTDAGRWMWHMIILTAANGVDLRGAGFRSQVLSIWAGGTTTRSNLRALQTIAGTIATRAEEIFGHGTVVRLEDITKTRKVV